ncbi:cupredoxin domain-containing protein [Candidatus Roizmanbacteria bacterium]|nr:cupredoxin domain-containing protein [Candidatus Roizmanbacteria bacterium]
MDKVFVTVTGSLTMIAIFWYFFLKKTDTVAVGDTALILVKGGYNPSRISIPSGKTTKIVFLRTDPSSCLEEVVLSDFKVRRFLPLNQKVAVELTPRASGTFTFACGMNMFRGTIIVK